MTGLAREVPKKGLALDLLSKVEQSSDPVNGDTGMMVGDGPKTIQRRDCRDLVR